MSAESGTWNSTGPLVRAFPVPTRYPNGTAGPNWETVTNRVRLALEGSLASVWENAGSTFVAPRFTPTGDTDAFENRDWDTSACCKANRNCSRGTRFSSLFS